ncbi:unnamed protein product [Durusdinium trenchii]|uniref:Uncharacterized protein n=1 Tax=Durusdinium trenchii TaxID=1381693 RepID=A0ABP0JPX4_9DINO
MSLTVSSLSGRSLTLHATDLENGLRKAVAQALEHPSFRTRLVLAGNLLPYDATWEDVGQPSEVEVVTLPPVMDFTTSLFHAVQKGDVREVKSILLKCQDPNCQDARGEVVSFLLECRADLEAADTFGRTALHLAALRDCGQAAQILLEWGIQKNREDSSGTTALYTAADKGNHGVLCVLLEASSDMEKTDSNGLTPLHAAASRGRMKVVVDLVSHSADMNKSCLNGITPLHAACDRGYGQIADFLIQSRADLDQGDLFESSPLHAAAAAGHHEVVRLLVEGRADLQVGNVNDVSPLHVAAAQGQIQVVELLVASGAQKDKVNCFGATPLRGAAEQGHYSVVSFLLQIRASGTVTDNSNTTALHSAAAQGHYDIAKLLVESKSDVNGASCDGITPLHAASTRGDSDLVEFLLSCRANPNQQNVKGELPLHAASALAHARVVENLLGARAKVNHVNSRGFSALHTAASLGRVEAARALVEAGAQQTFDKTLQCSSIEVMNYVLVEENADAFQKASEELAEKEEALENAIQKQQELIAQMNLVSGELQGQVTQLTKELELSKASKEQVQAAASRLESEKAVLLNEMQQIRSKAATDQEALGEKMRQQEKEAQKKLEEFKQDLMQLSSCKDFDMGQEGFKSRQQSGELDRQGPQFPAPGETELVSPMVPSVLIAVEIDLGGSGDDTNGGAATLTIAPWQTSSDYKLVVQDFIHNYRLKPIFEEAVVRFLQVPGAMAWEQCKLGTVREAHGNASAPGDLEIWSTKLPERAEMVCKLHSRTFRKILEIEAISNLRFLHNQTEEDGLAPEEDRLASEEEDGLASEDERLEREAAAREAEEVHQWEVEDVVELHGLESAALNGQA